MCGQIVECATRSSPSASTRNGRPSSSTRSGSRARSSASEPSSSGAPPARRERGHAREHGLAAHHHRLVLVPESRVERRVAAAERVDLRGRHARKQELDADVRRVRLLRRELRPDLRPGACARGGRGDVARVRTVEPHLHLDLVRRIGAASAQARAPAVRAGRQAADRVERAAVQARQMLPVEHVLPDALERRGDRALVDRDGDEVGRAHGPMIPAANRLLSFAHARLRRTSRSSSTDTTRRPTESSRASSSRSRASAIARCSSVEPEALVLLAREALDDISHLLRPGHLAQLAQDPRRPRGQRERPLRRARAAHEREHRRRPRAAELSGHRHRDRDGVQGPAGLDARRRRRGALARHLRRLPAAQPALLADGRARHVHREEHRHEPAGADRDLRRAGRRVPLPVHRQGRRLREQDVPVPGDEGAPQSGVAH